DLLQEMKGVATEEGRDVEAVVVAAVRRYLWDAMFRKLRRHAQARARAQGVASDEAVLMTVLEQRRPDEYSVPKETNLAEAIDEAEDVEAEEVTRPAPSRPRGEDTSSRRSGRSGGRPSAGPASSVDDGLPRGGRGRRGP